MIPDRVVEVIHGPAWMCAGTRDDRLRPAHTFVVGAMVHSDRETVAFFVPKSRSERILSHLKSNGWVALTVALPTHEAYQLKGLYLSSRAADAKDRTVQDIYRAKLITATVQGGYPEPLVRPLVLGYVYQPAVAITFRPEEIFVQTPGPQAGKKIG